MNLRSTTSRWRFALVVAIGVALLLASWQGNVHAKEEAGKAVANEAIS